MPNHVTNRITVLGTDEQVKTVMEFLKGEPFDDGEPRLIDFNRIIPQPSNIFLGSLGKEEEEMCKREGRPDWYSWNRENWGTKWGAYSIKQGEANQVIFETAWSFAEPVALKLAKIFPDVNILWDWADEDTGQNVGRGELKNGQLWTYTPEGGSKEAYEIVFDLKPYERDNYKLVDGEYEYIDTEE